MQEGKFMSNNLEKLINEKRKRGSIQQQQIAKKIGVTNVTLCQVQSGQKKLSREKLIHLATVLEVEYNELLKIMNYNLTDEYIRAFEKLVSANKNDCELFMLLAEVVKDSQNVEILKKLISLLVKADDKQKETLSNMLELLKNGIYGIYSEKILRQRFKVKSLSLLLFHRHYLIMNFKTIKII